MSKISQIYGIIGAGGFGREVMPIARQMIASLKGSNSEEYELVFVVENLKEQIVVNGHKVIPDGHFKIPHLWPGQNPPGDSVKYATSFQFKDPYLFLFHPEELRLFSVQREDASLRR
jgi:hypothetical protein